MAVMHAFDTPVTANELHQIWDEAKTPSTLDYHLCTLVEAGVVELVIGSELRFVLVDAIDEAAKPSFQGGAPQGANSSNSSKAL
ncbi:MAG TPA: hypothetical protein VGH58_07150 [Solirubrobacterales bacterium]